MSISAVPDDLWRAIAALSQDDLGGVLRMRLVNKQLNHAMKHPSVVSYLYFAFSHNQESPLVRVNGCFRPMPPEGLGPLMAGVRRALINSTYTWQSLAHKLSNLRHLELYHSALSGLANSLETLSLWSCRGRPDADFRRRNLNVASCPFFDFNSLSRMTWLESLDLQRAKFSSLNFVKPLAALRRLLVSRCHSLVDVNDLRSLTNLQALTIKDCPMLVDIDSLSYLTNLTELNLLQCHQIKPQDVQLIVDRLPKLKRMSILHHTIQQLTLAKVPNLTFLHMSNCIELTDLCELPVGIVELDLHNCSKLTDFSELARLVNLREWDLSGTNCHYLEL
jgi:Leucine-rich repeat (LRR) protein